MPAGTKAIQRRIKSVSNIKKITKAMEMVSAAKMRKATASVLATRPYSNLAWQIIGNIGKAREDGMHPLLQTKEKKSGKSLVIFISSDKGLCGGFNAQMFREIKRFVVNEQKLSRKLDFAIIGKRGEVVAHREKFSVIAVFENLTDNPKFTDIKSVAKIAMDKFIDGTYDNIHVAYTDYVSTLVQRPRVRQLLPIMQDEDLGEIQESKKMEKHENNETTEYVFEPDKNELLELMLPKIVETQVYQAVLESVASEQSARMVAMKNATDSAKEIVRDLTFTYNKIRQAGITQEISEISAGKAALE